MLLEARSIGVNYADCAVRMGLYASAKKYVGWPITPGFEVAGQVLAVGDGVADIAPGDEVVALVRFGAYAERVAVPAPQVIPLPAGWSVTEAGGFAVVFLTAWYAWRECSRPRPGTSVLVHSAAGGVGGALCQLARAEGVRAVGVVRGAHKVEAARAQGAEVVIDKGAEPLWAAVERAAPDGFSAVFDANGVETLRDSYEHLAPEGRLVVYGFHTMLRRGRDRPSLPRLAWGWLRTPRFDPLRLTGENRGVVGFNLSYLFDRVERLSADGTELLELAADGRIAPPATRTFPLEEVAQAHRAIESGESVGKLVLVP